MATAEISGKEWTAEQVRDMFVRVFKLNPIPVDRSMTQLEQKLADEWQLDETLARKFVDEWMEDRGIDSVGQSLEPALIVNPKALWSDGTVALVWDRPAIDFNKPKKHEYQRQSVRRSKGIVRCDLIDQATGAKESIENLRQQQ